jgi:hypothetical protein
VLRLAVRKEFAIQCFEKYCLDVPLLMQLLKLELELVMMIEHLVLWRAMKVAQCDEQIEVVLIAAMVPVSLLWCLVHSH